MYEWCAPLGACAQGIQTTEYKMQHTFSWSSVDSSNQAIKTWQTSTEGAYLFTLSLRNALVPINQKNEEYNKNVSTHANSCLKIIYVTNLVQGTSVFFHLIAG